MTFVKDLDFMHSPAIAVARLRAKGRLVREHIPLLGKIWVTTDQEVASLVLKDDETFSMRNKNGVVTGMQWWMPRFLKALAGNMLSSDEPDHKRLRNIVDQAFKRDAIMALEPRVEAIAADLADQLFAEGEEADLVTRYARKLPLVVICELLGLPEADRTKFSAWAEGLTRVEGAWSMLMAMPGLRAMTRYLDSRIEQAREAHGKGGPVSGLIGELVALDHEGDVLTHDELLAMVFLLLIAGHETTTHLISGSVLALEQNPDQKAMLLADENRYPLAIEELLRFVTPVQMTKPRTCRRDIQLGGEMVRQGELVVALLVAADFDQNVFDAPEMLDISRKPNHHMAFGTGIHFCLGHQLARMEAKYAIKALYARHPGLNLAAAGEVDYAKRIGIRVLRTLKVRV